MYRNPGSERGGPLGRRAQRVRVLAGAYSTGETCVAMQSPHSTRCNLTHCAWREAGSLRVEPVDPLAWRRSARELRVNVTPAGCKGLGVFAAQAAGPGRWVTSYVGEVLNISQLLVRYAREEPVFVFRLTQSLSIDARDSVHFSRFINHDARPNLKFVVSKALQSIDFFAIRPVHVGDELTIDYGLSYWQRRATVPDASTEPRLFSPELPSCLPPASPFSPAEVSAALTLPDEDAVTAFLRARATARGLHDPAALAELSLLEHSDRSEMVRALVLHKIGLGPAPATSHVRHWPRPSGADALLAWATGPARRAIVLNQLCGNCDLSVCRGHQPAGRIEPAV